MTPPFTSLRRQLCRYTPRMMNLALITVFTALAILLCAGFLHLLPRLGGFGRRISESMCRAPMLDVLITYFGIAPLAVGPIVGGWIGLAGGIFGQISAVLIWSLLHSAANPRVRRGPRIHRTLNQIVGPWRNYTALWLTALMVPMFWTVRMIEIFLYPFDPRSRALPEVRPRHLGLRIAPEVRRPHQPRPDLVPLLRLDDRCLVARLGDTAQRRIILVPHPILQPREVRQLPGRLSRRRRRMGFRRRNDDPGDRGPQPQVRWHNRWRQLMVRSPDQTDRQRRPLHETGVLTPGPSSQTRSRLNSPSTCSSAQS